MKRPARSLARLAKLFGVAALAACRATPAPAPTPLPPTWRDLPVVERVIPRPTQVRPAAGAPFTISPTTRIVFDPTQLDLAPIAERFASLLLPSTGHPIRFLAWTLPPDSGDIVLRVRTDSVPASPDGYRLRVSASGVEVSSRSPAGVFYGVQTLRQLLPAAIESHMKRGNTAWTMPAVEITDAPRFEWRGAMLDVARHFFTVREVQQYIDILALYKMNVLHLHLSDDQGWRIDIPSRPQLALRGGVTQVGGGPGGFYTQQEFAEIVRYARDRFITVVPEIDMPGHTNAALVAFPELSCSRRPSVPYTGTDVGWSAFCVDNELTYALIEDIVRDVAAVTPGPYFHMGGDEVEVLTPAQYATFVERVQGIVERHGKQMIGWEEIRKARLKPGSLIQQWRGDTLSVSPGVRVVMSPGKRMYIDMKYDDSTELGLKWAGLIEVRTVYDWDPAAYNPSVPASSIAGVEAPMWSETLRNITAVQYLAMPRLPAVAELGWTAQSQRNWEDFRVRLASHAPRWNFLGINYHRSPQIPW